MESYLDAIDDRQGCKIILGGRSVCVGRARLGLHLQLAKVAKAFDAANSARQKASFLTEYFDHYDLSIDDASAIELVEAFIVLRNLNLWQMEVPWLMPRPAQVKTAAPLPPYHYDSRWWATWVHEIASRYGWTRGEILNLWPEEASLYLQEIQVSQFYETEDRRALSEVSYEYNQATKKSRFRPGIKPPWMVDERLPDTIRVNVKLLPVGAIVPM